MVSPATAALAAQSIDRLVSALVHQAGITARSSSIDNVHDLRVAVRRLSQALVTFRGVLPRRETKEIREKLKVLKDRAGDVRDCDMARKILDRCPVGGTAVLRGTIAVERRKAAAALRSAIRAWKAKTQVAGWRVALAPDAAEAASGPELPKLARRYLKRGDAAAGKDVTADDLHRFRIESKKFRYALELLHPIYGAPVAEWLGRLKAVQSVLGAMQDSLMTREMVGRLGARAEIEAWLKKRQRRKAREFQRLWAESFGGAEAHRLAAGLSRPPRKPMARSVGSRPAVAKRA
jgi:CHAD domain-containing protein